MRRLIGICLVCVALCVLSKSSGAVDIHISGIASPQAAGMPDVKIAGLVDTDIALPRSPVFVQDITLTPGDCLKFYNLTGPAYGEKGDFWFCADSCPNRIFAYVYEEQFLKLDVLAFISRLIGVFFNDDVPSGMSTLRPDFTDSSAWDYHVLSPLLKQTFCVGGGLASACVQQRVSAPANVHRLFIVTRDKDGLLDNLGSITVHAVPEPSMFLIFGFGSLIFLKYKA